RDREARRGPCEGRWREVVCIASGPSLAADDVEKVKAWRQAKEGRGVIVTNTTFMLAPWADVLYAMDRAWWSKYHVEARQNFKGELVCAAERCFGVRRVRFKNGGNSGAGAMSLAAHWGA